MRRTFISLVLSLTVIGCAKQTNVNDAADAAVEPEEVFIEAPAITSRTVLADDIVWNASNPSAPAGVQVHILSGDPKQGAFTAVVQLPAGYNMGLHTHEAGFVGVALSDGIAHWSTADEPTALPKGSAWFQPSGEAHNDACVSEEPCVLMVFFDDKLDTVPTDAAPEAPTTTYVLADAIDWKLFNPKMPNGPQVAMIHGSPAEDAMWAALVQFPAGMETNAHTHTANFAGGLISGPHHRGASSDALQAMTPGSVWIEAANTPHIEKCGTEAPCIFAATMDGKMDQADVEIKTADEEAAPTAE